MLAHNIQKSQMGEFGFDTINIFTNDEIYCTGFTPNPFQIEEIGKLIEDLNQLIYSKNPICIYINQKHGLYWLDLKIFCLGEPIFADSQDTQLSSALRSLKNKIANQIPKHNFYSFDAEEVSNLYL